MKNFVFILGLFLILSSCATSSYNKEKNCSDRGLAALRSDSLNEMSEEEYLKNSTALKNLYLENTQNFKSCYQEYLDKSSLNKSYYRVCTVSEITDGKLTFLDIADKENNLDKDLQKCLENKFHALNFNFLQIKGKITVEQPLNFRGR